MKKEIIIISLGGSLIYNRSGLDIVFLKKFKNFIIKQIRMGKRFVIVAGGGVLCRNYQEMARRLNGTVSERNLDWIGIKSTKLNAELLRSMFGNAAHNEVIDNPLKKINSLKDVIIGAGFLPGSSSDKDAVLLAKNFGADFVVNLSNINYLYNKDPKKYQHAKAIKNISWKDFRKMINKKWVPGENIPFDPIASRFAEGGGIKVVILNGKEIKNFNNFLDGRKFKGTVIG